MEFSGLDLKCKQHDYKAMFICVDKQCQQEQRLLCPRCISKQLHKNHDIIDFIDANVLYQECIQQSVNSIHPDISDALNAFIDKKQQLTALISTIDQQLIAILLPDVAQLNKCLQNKDGESLATFLTNPIKQEEVKPQQSIDLESINDKVTQSLDVLSKISEKLANPGQKRYWNLSGQMPGHSDLIYSISTSPDGKLAITGSGDQTIRVWDLQNNKQLGDPITAHEGIVWSVAYGLDCFVSGSDDNTIKFWDCTTNKLLQTINTNDPVFQLTFNENYEILASGIDNMIVLWKNKEKKKLVEFIGHADYVTTLQFHNQYLVSGSKDKSVRLWNISTQQLVKSFFGHTNTIRSVALSKDGKSIASGGYDKIIRVWNIESGENVELCHGDIIWTIQFTDDNRVVSGGRDAKIRFWDIGTGKQNEEPVDCLRVVMAMSLSKDNQSIVAAVGRDVCIFENHYQQD